jgi:hypothetical protein
MKRRAFIAGLGSAAAWPVVELRGVMTFFFRQGALTNSENAAPAHAVTQSWSVAETKLRQGIFYLEDQQTAAYRALEQCLLALKSDADAPLPET